MDMKIENPGAQDPARAEDKTGRVDDKAEPVGVSHEPDSTSSKPQAALPPELNTVEPDIAGKEKQALAGDAENKRAAWLKKAETNAAQPAPAAPTPAGNKVESDEIFTASEKAPKLVVPADIEQKYIRVGAKFYHPKNTDLVAFEDKGNKLETKSNSENIAESMVRIAEARGWDEIKVSGAESFRREVWLEAASRGMHVKGYNPSEQDKVEVAKRTREIESNKVEKDAKPFRARENEQTQPDSKAQPPAPADAAPVDKHEVLVKHGAAKYQHDDKNADSYYVTTRDQAGTEKTSWGVDLKRAVKESGAKVGEKVELANMGKQDVTITVPVRDKGGNMVGHEEKEVQRNVWNVKKAEAFANESPERAVKQHPDLAGAVAVVSAIEKKTETDYLTPAQRAAVMARVRQNVINSIERGDSITVKMREHKEVIQEAKQEREHTR